jgi:hypothetical protein
MFGKPKTHRIMGSYQYLPIRDPRIDPITTEDLIPSFPGSDKSGDEFLQKYLYLVRNHMSRELVAEWFQACDRRKDSYIEVVSPDFVGNEFIGWSSDFDEDEFLGYMVQGFAMAVAEYESFGIAQAGQMADCVWGAMKNFSIQILLDSNKDSQHLGLAALLSGYHVAREIQKKNFT